MKEGGERGAVDGCVRKQSEMPTDKRSRAGTKRKEGGGRARESGAAVDGLVQEELEATPVAKKRKSSDSDGRVQEGLVVGYTPNMPQRYGNLLRLITFLLPYKNQGKAHECYLNRVGTLMRRKRCDLCLFFEWVPKDKKMFCWIYNTLTRTCAQFLVNPAFASQMLEVKVKRATCVFSTNFCSDGKWAAVKQTLEMMFCPPQHKTSEALDNLYIFTRIDGCIYFRNLEIKEFPDIARGKVLFLKEVGPYFCLKLMDIHGETAIPDPAVDVSQHQIVCPVQYSSLSPQLGFCVVPHSLCLNGEDFVILLKNGQDLSEFEGYDINLQEFLEEQSFLKRKYIVGSKTGDEHMFVRNIGKAIIRSLFAYFIKLFFCHKCLKMNIGGHTNILLKGSKVKFYGVELVEYEENLAAENVQLAVEFVRGCFPLGSIPCDLEDMLDLLLDDPLQNLQAAEDDCSLKSAKERRELLVLLHTEYMTNVKPKLRGEGDDDFFKGCPYLYSWEDTMLRNTYLTAVANYNCLLGDKKLEKRKEEEREKKKKEEREKKKKEESEKKNENLVNEEDDVGRIEDGKLGVKGELQLCVMRNCDVHIPETAVKDGITPFRLTWSDYIRSFYFPKYLSFVQKRMAKYLKSRSDNGNEVDEVTCREDEARKIIADVTSGLLSNGQ